MTSTAAPIAALQALGRADVASGDGIACQGLLGHIRRLRGYLDAYEAKVLVRVDELAEVGASFGSEATSTRCSGVSSKEAGTRKDRAKTLDELPAFGDALAEGEVTAEHVDKLADVARALTDEVRSSLFERVDHLLGHAASHDPTRFGRHVRDLARNLERQAGIDRDRQQRAATFLSWKVAADGMYDVHARLHPLAGNRLVRALDAEVAARIAAGEAAGEREFVERTINRGRVAAEALVDLVSGGHQMTRPIVADVSVLVDADTLVTGEHHDHTVCETTHGAALPIESVRALLCGGLITPVILGVDGTVLDAGRTIRTPNREQRRALRAMYRTCAAHGCDVGFDRCEVHHIIPWEQRGPTDLDNLLPVCSRHHHLIHAHGWRLHLAPDRTLTVTDRHGEIVMVTTPDMPHRSRHHTAARHRPPGPAPAGDPDRPPQLAG